jgi:recombinational DNA repair protein (RecF pathway)
MSLFKSSWIILKISSLKENEFLFDVFTYEYGKLKMKAKKSKKEKNLDIWYIINFEVNVKKENTIHEIRNIKIKNEFDYNYKTYETIYEYLFLLKNISDGCPYHMPIYEIYNIVYHLYQLENISEEKIIFSHLKILNVLWILNENSNNPMVKKILSFIQKESIKNILKLKWLDENLKNELKTLLMK